MLMFFPLSEGRFRKTNLAISSILYVGTTFPSMNIGRGFPTYFIWHTKRPFSIISRNRGGCFISGLLSCFGILADCYNPPPCIGSKVFPLGKVDIFLTYNLYSYSYRYCFVGGFPLPGYYSFFIC